MTRRDTFTDIAAIRLPLPLPTQGNEDDEGFLLSCVEVTHEREEMADRLRLAWEEGDQDPLIAALQSERRLRAAAERRIRELLAYGREFVQPRPYTLGDLAAAAGMSVSGVRTAYAHRDVDAVAQATGAKPREWRAADPEPESEGQA